MAEPRRLLRIVVPVVAVLAALGAVAWLVWGRGGDEPTALPITQTEWADPTHLFTYVGCATITDVEVDRTGELPEVSIAGHRKGGGCQEFALIKVEEGATEIVDGTTGEPVELPTYRPGPATHGG